MFKKYLLTFSLMVVASLSLQSLFAEETTKNENCTGPNCEGKSSNMEEMHKGMGMKPGMGMMQKGMGMKPGMGMHPRFEDVDTNKDGKISKSELTTFRSKRQSERAKEGHMMKNVSKAPSFEDLDKNHDKSLSKEEFSPAMGMKTTN